MARDERIKRAQDTAELKAISVVKSVEGWRVPEKDHSVGSEEWGWE